MGQKIGVVSSKDPGEISNWPLDGRHEVVMWFVDLAGAYAHMIGSPLDILLVDHEITPDLYFKRFSLLNPRLKIQAVNLTTGSKKLTNFVLANHVADFGQILRTGLVSTNFQPIIKLQDNREEIFGVECLSRITMGQVSYPPDFVFSYAQEMLSLVSYDQKCLQEAIKNLPVIKSVPIFLNIRPQTLISEDFFAWFSKISYPELVLEITEQHGMFYDSDLERRVGEIRKLGVKIAIDDFGSGLSNLAMLHGIKPDVIKVAGRFVSKIDSCRDKQKIIANIIKLAQDFGTQAVFENVENQQEWDVLKSLGANLGQGYYFHRPMTKDALMSLLSSEKLLPK